MDWCLFIDIDEYFRLNPEWSLDRFINHYKDKSSIRINWKFYGANRLCKHRDESV